MGTVLAFYLFDPCRSDYRHSDHISSLVVFSRPIMSEKTPFRALWEHVWISIYIDVINYPYIYKFPFIPCK